MKIIPGNSVHLKSATKVAMETGWYDKEKEALNDLKEKIVRKTLFLALENEEVMGYMYYAKSYSHEANFLSSVAVAKKYRRKGVAKKLIEKYIEISEKETPKEQKYALSSTDKKNKTSIKMHEVTGFKRLGVIKELHYGTDEIFFGYKLR